MRSFWQRQETYSEEVSLMGVPCSCCICVASSSASVNCSVPSCHGLVVQWLALSFAFCILTLTSCSCVILTAAGSGFHDRWHSSFVNRLDLQFDYSRAWLTELQPSGWPPARCRELPPGSHDSTCLPYTLSLYNERDWGYLTDVHITTQVIVTAFPGGSYAYYFLFQIRKRRYSKDR